jgi:hypothetical protein
MTADSVSGIIEASQNSPINGGFPPPLQHLLIWSVLIGCGLGESAGEQKSRSLCFARDFGLCQQRWTLQINLIKHF